MGNVCSPSFSCDDSVSHCLDCSVRKAGYICHLQDNLDALQRELQMLIEERNDVRVRVIVAEQQQMKRLERVQGWLSRVEKVESRVGKLIRKSPQQVEKLCLGGFCSNSCKSSYKFGKKVVKALRVVQSLRKQGDFQDVAQPAPENPVDERPLPATVVGLQSTFDRVWKCLMEEQMGIVGLYGMGGVGKTTLLTQINNKFLDTPNRFDFVIWIVVSKDLQLAKIQEGIAKKIGLFNESWQSKGLEEKANKIFKILSKKKFVLLLDDIWELVDLAQVGLPVSSCASASNKIVFTTREIEVCGQMESHRSVKVECLGFDDAWKLFEERVGRDTLDTHPDIPELAEAVARECGGLPLALITVGRAMASRKTSREWEHAIEVLRCSASQFSGLRHLQTLHLTFNDLEEIKINGGEVKRVRELSGFHSLKNVYISSSKLRHATWLFLAPNLKRVEIENCQDMEEIISSEKLSEVPAEVMENLIPFARLERLILEELKNLKTIHSKALPFPCLKEMSVDGCPLLKKLPLDCNRGLERKIIIKGQRRWWNELQWDDEATQNAFLPCFKPF